MMEIPSVIATCSDDDLSVISYGSYGGDKMSPELEGLEASLVSLDPVDLGSNDRWDSSQSQPQSQSQSQSNMNMSSCAAVTASNRNLIRRGKKQGLRKQPPQRVSNFSCNSAASLLSNSSHGLSKLKRSMSRLEYDPNSSASFAVESDASADVACTPQESSKPRRSSLLAPPTRPERMDSYGAGQIQKRAQALQF